MIADLITSRGVLKISRRGFQSTDLQIEAQAERCMQFSRSLHCGNDINLSHSKSYTADTVLRLWAYECLGTFAYQKVHSYFKGGISEKSIKITDLHFLVQIHFKSFKRNI